MLGSGVFVDSVGFCLFFFSPSSLLCSPAVCVFVRGRGLTLSGRIRGKPGTFPSHQPLHKTQALQDSVSAIGSRKVKMKITDAQHK